MIRIVLLDPYTVAQKGFKAFLKKLTILKLFKLFLRLNNYLTF